jgi:hypothetical protein
VTAFRPCAAVCGAWLPAYQRGRFCSHRCRQRGYRARLKQVLAQQLVAFWQNATYSHAANVAALVEAAS